MASDNRTEIRVLAASGSVALVSARPSWQSACVASRILSAATAARPTPVPTDLALVSPRFPGWRSEETDVR